MGLFFAQIVKQEELWEAGADQIHGGESPVGWAGLPCFPLRECPCHEGMLSCKLVIKNGKNSIPWRCAPSYWCRHHMGLIQELPELWDWTER